METEVQKDSRNINDAAEALQKCAKELMFKMGNIANKQYLKPKTLGSLTKAEETVA